MEKFSVFVNNVDSLVWSMVLVVLCLGVGLYLSIRLKFPQIRLMKEMIHLLMDKEESESGITPFQAFATTVGARVGMGNIAGVASAIFYGGPGSVFWMWMIAAIGASVEGLKIFNQEEASPSISSSRMICAVTVVPTLAPRMIPIDCLSERMPAPTRPEVRTMVAVEL